MWVLQNKCINTQYDGLMAHYDSGWHSLCLSMDNSIGTGLILEGTEVKDPD